MRGFAITICLLGAWSAAAQEVPESLRWDEFYDSVKNDLRSDDAKAQMAALERFKDHDYRLAGEFLIKMIEASRTPPVQAAKAAEIVGGMRNPEVQQLLVDRVKAQLRPNRHLLAAYASLDPVPADLEDVLFKAIAKQPPPALLADVLKRVGDLDPAPVWAEPRLINTLGPENYHAARRAAAETLGKIESPAAVEALLPFVPDKVIGLEVRTALTRLTGQEHWRDAAAWTGWWASAKKSGFKPAALDDAKLTALVKKLAEADGMDLEFYGIKLEGQNILFLLDSSGSMQGPRLEALKRELLSLLQAMDERYRFGMVLFPMDKYPSRGIEPATDEFKEKAARFIDRMSASGGTPVSDAVEYAFEKVVVEHNVDTIYLLSDGAPDDPPEEVRLLIQGFNEMALTRIHTISIGEASEFLQNVALDNGGKYAEVQ